MDQIIPEITPIIPIITPTSPSYIIANGNDYLAEFCTAN